jgi:hypothetical protein
MQMIQNAARFAYCVCKTRALSPPRRFSAAKPARIG